MRKKGSVVFETKSSEVFCKKVFLKISKYSLDKAFVEVFFNKVKSFRPATLLKDSNKCFLVNIATFLRTHILKNLRIAACFYLRDSFVLL